MQVEPVNEWNNMLSALRSEFDICGVYWCEKVLKMLRWIERDTHDLNTKCCARGAIRELEGFHRVARSDAVEKRYSLFLKRYESLCIAVSMRMSVRS